jgi:hypothetical protein
MNRDKIYFGKLVDSILEDIRKENHKFFKLEKHLTDVNETIPDKYQINELIQIRNCLKRAVTRRRTVVMSTSTYYAPSIIKNK